MSNAIPRRQAREIIANATRVLHRYKSLDPLQDYPWEETETPVAELLELFNANSRWKLERFSNESFVVHVPNIYAWENYVVVP